MLSERRKDKRNNKTKNINEEHAYCEKERTEGRSFEFRGYIALPKCETEPVIGGFRNHAY
jgi:hypothetical protein